MENTPTTPPDTAAARVDADSAHLEGSLGTGGLLFTVLAFNAPIGIMSGFIPVVITMGVGGPTPLVYLGVMAMVLFFAAGLVTMAKHMSKPGAFYTYVTHALGRSMGLGAGFTALATYVVLASATYIFMGTVANTVSTGILHGPDLPWWAWTLIAWALVSALTLLNIDVSTRVLGVLLCVEVLVVLVWDLRVFFDGGPAGRGLELSIPAGGSWGLALLLAVGCLTGFESIQVFRSETRDADRTIPRATYLVIIILSGFYAFNSWIYQVAFGGTDGIGASLAQTGSAAGSFFDSLKHYVATVASDAANVLVVTSLFAAVLAVQNISARYTFALGNDGVLPSALSRVHPRWKSPTLAAGAVAVAVLAIDLVLAVARVNPVTWYVALQGLGLWGLILLMAWTSVAIIVFFRSRSDLEASLFKTLIAPILSAIGFGITLFLSFKNADLLFGTTATGYWCMVSLCAVAVVGSLYALWLKSAKPAVWARIGAQDDVH
ncbi:APC family permease [Streptomyces sp. NPDC006197]|uniref:APC family permease n=1 Tax=Streptomyces sp. NPDC006197 TaxID=3156685 RepID=UPI0033BD7E71